ncbi:MAG TPA: GNAT family N-acetyltransferase [Lentimicrobium sp.]|nr:GNAT family N-acetyltransferase [Lentimicrobium sp.]
MRFLITRRNQEKQGETRKNKEKQMKTIPTKTWYLEMRSEPAGETLLSERMLSEGLPKELEPEGLLPEGPLPEGFKFSHWKPSTEEYLEMYKAVGGGYNWVDRILMPELKLKEILQSIHTELLLLSYNGDPAGFAECSHAVEGETELVYFGLTEKYTGRKAGFPFLMKVIRECWKYPINRLWLHTCDLDHPAALPMYQKAGFVVYKTETIMQPVK